MQKIVLDIEMCRVQNQYEINRFPYKNEIIQIGAVKLDDDYKIIDSFSSCVHPEYGKIDSFISNLTGIHEREVKNAPLLIEVLENLVRWIGNDDAAIYTWSSSDFYQLRHEIEGKSLEGDFLESLMKKAVWIDYQAIFCDRFGFNRAISLSEALELTEITVDGRLHDGLTDAYHTAKLIAKLEQHPEFQLSELLIKARNGDAGTLTFSLGNLFQNIVLA